MIKDLITIFDSKNVSYTIIYEDEKEAKNSNQWINNNFPIQVGGRIDWLKVKNHMTIKCNLHTKHKSTIQNFINQYNIKNKKVIISWTNLSRPIIKIDLSDFIVFSNIIFEEDWDTWIYSPKDSWLIEFNHDNELSIGLKSTTIS